ncbi:hypothetical protein [Sporomusa silvacetica]|nr:hypothetical protein [Sporomusa silvacetica]
MLRARRGQKRRAATIRVRAEETVNLENEGKRKARDIDILIELFNTSQPIQHTKMPQYAFAVENKIRDGAIVRGDDQLFQEIVGLRNRYTGTVNTENAVQPVIALIFLAPKTTKRAEEEFQQMFVKLTKHFPGIVIPCQQMTWGTTDEESRDTVSAQLVNVLEWEATGRIEPVYEYTKHTIKSFLTFIRSDFQSYQEEKSESFERW